MLLADGPEDLLKNLCDSVCTFPNCFSSWAQCASIGLSANLDVLLGRRGHLHAHA
jgi:hypothetical protein